LRGRVSSLRLRIVFAHGLESGPQGRKTQWLRAAGHEVVAPDGRGASLGDRTTQLAAILPQHPEALIVGSSFGGLVALLAAARCVRDGHAIAGMLLLAPAIVLPPPPGDVVPCPLPWPTTVLHGMRDEILDPDPVRTWAHAHGARWLECDDDHSLAASHDAIFAALADVAARARGATDASPEEHC
jgi:pimeloyl-ACP methyl ester carboxylesterase